MGRVRTDCICALRPCMCYNTDGRGLRLLITGALPGGVLSARRALTISRTAWRRTSTAVASRLAASPAAMVSEPAQLPRVREPHPCLPGHSAIASAAGVGRPPCASLLPVCAGQKCSMNSDCQSESCVDGLCAEAKYCASRFFTDTFGGQLQLRTALQHHEQKLIQCGQCVCQNCTVRNCSRRPLVLVRRGQHHNHVSPAALREGGAAGRRTTASSGTRQGTGADVPRCVPAGPSPPSFSFPPSPSLRCHSLSWLCHISEVTRREAVGMPPMKKEKRPATRVPAPTAIPPSCRVAMVATDSSLDATCTCPKCN